MYMKLAFTTLGCPNWNMETIIEQAVKNGYHGVDFRGYLGEMEIYQLPEFSTNLNKTKKQFEEAGLEIPCFSSSVRLFTNTSEEVEKFLNELEEYGKLCQAFSTPYVRVFGGHIGNTERTEALQIVKENLEKYLSIAEKYDIILLLETHDSWTDCQTVRTVLEVAESERLQVLWDVHHPYRNAGEAPEKTWNILGDRIRYTHWKDSYLKEGTNRGYQLCLMGEGDIPLQEIMQLLVANGYDGYYTLEWEKLWAPEIEEPEVAIPQYADFMRQLKKTISSK